MRMRMRMMNEFNLFILKMQKELGPRIESESFNLPTCG